METIIENPDTIQLDLTQLDVKHTIDLLQLFACREKSCLLILNQAISLEKALFVKLWNISSICICADGGANRLFDLFEATDRENYLPNYIVGDLDSIRNDVKEYYRSCGVIIILQRTQYSTDFKKCIETILLHFNCVDFVDMIKSSEFDDNNGINKFIELKRCPQWNDSTIHVKVLNAIGGRFDHSVNAISELYHLEVTSPCLKIVYFTSTNLLFLAPAGGNFINFTSDLNKDVLGTCGLLPLSGKSNIRVTKGLKWDIQQFESSIVSGKISSSNWFVGENGCFIDADSSIVICIELKWSGVRKHYLS